MFARHLFATGDPRQLDDAVTAIRTQGRELLREQPGYTGLTIFTDPALFVWGQRDAQTVESASDASRAPSVIASSLAHTIVSWVRAT